MSKQFDGSKNTTARFHLRQITTPEGKHLEMSGLDDDGDGFVLTLDQLWSATLLDEIESWFASLDEPNPDAT